MFKRTLQISVLLLAALVSLFSCRNLLIESAAPLILQRAGFRDIRVTGVSLGATSSSLQDFSLTSTTASAGTVKITARGIGLDYTLKTLIDGRLNHLNIDSLQVSRTTPPAVTGNTWTFDRFTGRLKTLAEKVIPVDSIEIEHIRLDISELGSLSGKILKASLQVKDSGVYSQVSYQEGHQKLYQLNGKLYDKGDLNLRLTVRDKGISPIALELALARGKVTGQMSCDLNRLDLIQPFSSSPLPELRGQLSANILMDPTSTTGGLQLKATGTRLQYKNLEAGALNLELDLKGLSTDQTLVLAPSSHLSADTLLINGHRADHLDIDLTGQLQYHNKRYHFTFTPTRPWHLTGVQGAGVRVGELILGTPKSILAEEGEMLIRSGTTFGITALQLDFNQFHIPKLVLFPAEQNRETVIKYDEQGLVVHSGQWKTGDTTLTKGSFGVDAAPLLLNFEHIESGSSGLSATLSISTGRVELTDSNRSVQFENMVSRLQLDDSKLKGYLTWELEGNPGILQATLNHDISNRSGTAKLKTKPEIQLNGSSRPLSRLLNPLRLPMTFDKATLALMAQARWTAAAPLQLSTDIVLKKGAGTVRNLPFSGLEIKHKLQILPQLKSLEQGELSVARIEGPVPIDDLGLKLVLITPENMEKPGLSLQNIGCRLLGGTLRIEKILFDFKKLNTPFTVKMKDLNLPELVMIQQVKGLDISGQVEGSLPVVFSKGKLRINQGRIYNAPGGGVIHYQPPEGYSGDSHLTDYALKALEEFHYHKLKAEVNYNPDGNLIIAMQLQGQSPKLETNRPVHLNVTTEQNLLSLLQSLKYSKSLTDELDTQVQQHFLQPPSN